jgi:hypothetical protein
MGIKASARQVLALARRASDRHRPGRGCGPATQSSPNPASGALLREAENFDQAPWVQADACLHGGGRTWLHGETL